MGIKTKEIWKEVKNVGKKEIIMILEFQALFTKDEWHDLLHK